MNERPPPPPITVRQYGYLSEPPGWWRASWCGFIAQGDTAEEAEAKLRARLGLGAMRVATLVYTTCEEHRRRAA